MNGFFDGERRLESDAVLAVVPHGTGSDFRRVLNLPDDARTMAGVIEGFRWALLGGRGVPLSLVAASSAVTLILLVGGLSYFARVERTFADVV